jgi:hypothetical protein
MIARRFRAPERCRGWTYHLHHFWQVRAGRQSYGYDQGASRRCDWARASPPRAGVATETESLARRACQPPSNGGEASNSFLNSQGRTFGESPHVGAEYVDDLGRSFDALGSPAASAHWNQTQFLRSIDSHLLKSND